MPVFDFITSEDLRSSLDGDARELSACAAARAWKAVHVLAGSIIEAVLIDHLDSLGKASKADPLKMQLADLIDMCREEKILSQKAVDLSAAVKGYRNLIHPGRLIRFKEAADENSATIARSLVEIIVDEVANRRRQSYGYTAEQIISKIRRDPSAVSIIEHLLKRLNERETERLLIGVLPKAYIELQDATVDATETLSLLGMCFRLAFDRASEPIQRTIARRYLTVLQEEGEYTVALYERAFFRCGDLKFYSDDEAAMAKAHLFATMSKHLDEGLLEVCAGVGTFLTENDTKLFLKALISQILPDTDLKYLAIIPPRIIKRT